MTQGWEKVPLYYNIIYITMQSLWILTGIDNSILLTVAAAKLQENFTSLCCQVQL